jgi:hypothetical protein
MYIINLELEHKFIDNYPITAYSSNVYTKALNDTEVLQNYNATKNKIWIIINIFKKFLLFNIDMTKQEAEKRYMN